MSEQPFWPHQPRTIDLAEEAVREGYRSVLITAPTGAGKTRIITELARRAAAKRKRVGIFTNRRILTEQATQILDRHGIAHGVVAAGYDPALLRDVQILSMQTVASRVFGGAGQELPPMDLAVIDEAHSNKADTATRVITMLKERGAVILGFTATPVGLGFEHQVNGAREPLYSRLIVAATPSEVRRCGALVPCDVYAPDEPDMKGVKRSSSGEFVAEAAARRAMETLVFGNVFEHWARLNPQRHPTLVWAPSVATSRWFAGEFVERGVAAFHIDGETPQAERLDAFEACERGGCPVLTSCGVMREGVDLPFVRHGILVQPCGALSTFLQIVGRLLRAYPGKDRAVLQDHAGAWHRHGSPNADREWSLADDDRSIAGRKKEAREQGLERQPIACPRCNGVRAAGPSCPFCGHQHQRSVRHVRMTGGKLVRMVGDVVKKKRAKTVEQKVWDSCLYAAAAGGRTLAQAAGHFRAKTGQALPGGLENAPPHESLDWQRAVTDVYPWFARRKSG